MAECPDVAEFRARFPAFATVLDLPISIQLADACDTLSVELFGAECWRRAVFYYSAHTLVLELKVEANSVNGIPKNDKAGLTTSSGADGLSMGYSGYVAKDSGEAWYYQTPYGRTFLQIADGCVDINSVGTVNFS